jgi:ABC-type lipoprotein export system ATPase subunit
MSKNNATEPAIRVRNIHKSYRLGKTTLDVLRGVSFQIQPGEFVVIVGASGSGKSTLLHLVGLLDRPDEGSIALDGRDVAGFSSARRNAMRCHDIGFVFQFYHLLPELNVLENAMMPARVGASGLSWLGRRAGARQRAAELLERLALGDRLGHKPQELSGGERQRVAIARALINHPGLLLADEPTGNLDSKTGRQIMDVLLDFQRQRKQTMLMVTHDLSLAEQADRVLHLTDGRLSQAPPVPKGK